MSYDPHEKVERLDPFVGEDLDEFTELTDEEQAELRAKLRAYLADRGAATP